MASTAALLLRPAHFALQANTAIKVLQDARIALLERLQQCLALVSALHVRMADTPTSTTLHALHAPLANSMLPRVMHARYALRAITRTSKRKLTARYALLADSKLMLASLSAGLALPDSSVLQARPLARHALFIITV